MRKYLYLLMLSLLLTRCGDDKKPSTPPPSPPPPPPVEETMTEAELLDLTQKSCLNYMWEGAQSNSGMALERIHPEQGTDNVVTTGGTGFGIAGLIVGVERQFIDRAEAVERLHKIVDFLDRADRFHGVWPHWLKGNSGEVHPFSPKDNGADLVEGAFLMQGLLCAHQYFKDGNAREVELSAKIDLLWRGMNFRWFTKDGTADALYWHWSPNYGWEINMALRGFDETLITYILGAASPTYAIDPRVYHSGWARNGAIVSSSAPYGHPLLLRHNGNEAQGGPLFWSHYSFFGLSPKGLSDQYANYWDVVRNHTLANHDYCVANPKKYKNYSEKCWGLTASYSSPDGYNAHSPSNDLGIITPTAALSSFPYTPEESMKALKYFYYEQKSSLWNSKYGFYDAFKSNMFWVSDGFLAIDQCTIAPMIENHRTGLIWKLFMSHPDIQNGLTKLGFTYMPPVE